MLSPEDLKIFKAVNLQVRLTLARLLDADLTKTELLRELAQLRLHLGVDVAGCTQAATRKDIMDAIAQKVRSLSQL